MNNCASKPAIFIPIEIKARELNSKILFALRAIERGYRVYIGNKEGVRDILEARAAKSGIYFYKSGNLRDRINIVKKYCEALIVLDEERGVAIDSESVANIYPRTESHEYIDKYFVISDKHRRILVELRPSMSGKIFVTGWPRVDLWRKEFNNIYHEEVARIHQEFGEFFLFSSDFGCVSSDSVARAVSRLEMRWDNQELIKTRASRYNRHLEEFRSLVATLHQIEADPQFPRIVIRPHPAEDHSVWHNAVKGFKKIRVVYRGEITPWLLASSGVIHRGCTTAVQSYFSGKPTFLWLPFNREIDKEILPYKLSTKVSDLPALKKHLQEVLTGSYVQPGIAHDIADEIYTTDRLACDCILDHVGDLAVTSEPPIMVKPVTKALIALRSSLLSARDRLRILRDDYKANKRSAKMSGGITVEEVSAVAANIADLSRVSISRVVNNVVVFEKLNGNAGLSSNFPSD